MPQAWLTGTPAHAVWSPFGARTSAWNALAPLSGGRVRRTRSAAGL